MVIYIKNLNSNANTPLNIADCSLIVGSKQYIIKNNKAYERIGMNGEVHLTETGIIEVNDYHEKLFMALANTDGNSKLDKNDLAKLDPQKLQEELKQSAQQEKMYQIACKENSKSSIEFGFDITDKNDESSLKTDILGIRFSNKTLNDENKDKITDIEYDSNLPKFAKSMGLTVAGSGLFWAFSKKRVRKTTGKLAKKIFNGSNDIMKRLPKKVKLVGALGLAGLTAYKLLSKDTTEKVSGLSVEHENLFNNFETEQIANKKEKNSKIGGAVLGAAAVGSTWAMVESKSVRNFVKQILGKIGNFIRKVPPKYRWIGGILTVGLTACGVSLNKNEELLTIEHKPYDNKIQDNLVSENEYVSIDKSISEYEVQKGDTIIRIANKLGVTTERLREANPDLDWKYEWIKADGQSKMVGPNLKEGQKINVPARYMLKKGAIKNLEDLAKATGLSKEAVKLLMRQEGVEGGKPKLKTYKCPSGKATIGFGHTGYVDGKLLDYDNPITITKQKAYELLADDILKHKLDAIVYVGKDNFEKAPLSIQESMVNETFLRGIQDCFEMLPNSPTNHFRESLKAEGQKDEKSRNYGIAAANLRKRCGGKSKKGLETRIMENVLWAIKGLKTYEEKMDAINEIKDKYYELVSLYTENERKNLPICKEWEKINAEIKEVEKQKYKRFINV